jgi:rhamnosyltransferase subunit B
MARIVITTFGSSGDLNPFLALALGLRASGHDVVFAVEEGFRASVESAGFPVRPMTGDAMGTMSRYTDDIITKSTPVQSVRILVEKYLAPTLRAKIADLRAATTDADLLISSMPALAASFVADLTGIPLLAVALTPIMAPSQYIDPSPFPVTLPAGLQRAANRAGWWFGMWVVGRMLDTPVNEIRAEYGLPRRRNWMYTVASNSSAVGAAVAVSPAFCPPPPDWPSSVRETGFLFWDRPASWREPPELTDFLSGSAPVVAVSTGSMSPGIARAFAAFYRASVGAILRVGARAMVIGASRDILPDPLPPGVLALPFAPFSEVYPRCAAVIHHGGIGTTAQGLRAGVPQLIVPWGVDQFFTGTQIQRIGAGRWLQRKSYTEPRAARLLGALLHDPRYRERALALAAVIAREDGVGTLCAAVDSLLNRNTALPHPFGGA